MNDRAERLSGVVRDQTLPNCRPRDAASLVIVKQDVGDLKILMGRRHKGHIFIPDKYVFPGGKVERGDRLLSQNTRLHPQIENKLLNDMKGTSSLRRVSSLGLAAIRETFEETGITIGCPFDNLEDAPKTQDPGWRRFYSQCVKPDLSKLGLIARAITPPRRPRRYDTRFFCIHADEICTQDAPTDEELAAVKWFTLREAYQLDIPMITRIILEELADRLNEQTLFDPATPIPYYRARHGRFIRSLL